RAGAVTVQETSMKWGLIATGHIAEVFAKGLLETDSGSLYAAGSRNRDKAAAFAERFGGEKAYGGYQEVLDDPVVEAVYISTPHTAHAEWAVKAAEAGKAILCEKPITMNLRDAERAIEAARTHEVFLMEAFMYRCNPQTFKLIELIRDGAIGSVRAVRACFAFDAPRNLEGRLLNPALGGGGILDVGCYPISFARLMAGAAMERDFADPVALKGLGHIGADSKVDEWAGATLKFENGIVAQAFTGVQLTTETAATVYGTEGRIHLPEPWRANGRGPGRSTFQLLRDGREPETVEITADRSGYAYEADVVAEYRNRPEAPFMRWADTLGNMRTLDRWRAEIGLTYPGE
ncbi:MAG: Gfo/Idh/MocA family oxidoreductase, partial [Verrucomicrobiota bacterium]